MSGKVLYQRYCASCHRADLRGTPPEFPSLVGIGARRNVDEIAEIVREGGGRMPGYKQLHGAVRRAIVEYMVSGRSVMVRADRPTPFDVPYTLDGDIRFTDPDGFPAITPPWGTLTAIDLNKAAIAWQVPLGEMPGSGLEDTGSENYGGPVVTAGGLVFIGATNYDSKFRAFDAATARCCGKRRCQPPAMRRPLFTRSPANSSSSLPPAVASGARQAAAATSRSRSRKSVKALKG